MPGSTASGFSRASSRRSSIHSIREPPETPIKLFKVKSRLRNAEDVTFLPDDGLAVADRRAKRVRIFDNEGDFDKTLIEKVHPLGITANRSGVIAFTCRGKKKSGTVQLNALNGELVSRWGEDRLWSPRGIAFNNKGQLVVTDVHAYKHSVGIYTMDGRPMVSFGSKGSGKTQFQNPNYVAVDVYDRVLVSDKDNHCVKVFDDRGKMLGKFGRPGSGPGQFLSPRGIACDAQGNIVVVDSGNQRVCMYAADGRYVTTLLKRKDGVTYPCGIAMSRSEKLALTHHKSAAGEFHKLRVYQT